MMLVMAVLCCLALGLARNMIVDESISCHKPLGFKEIVWAKYKTTTPFRIKKDWNGT